MKDQIFPLKVEKPHQHIQMKMLQKTILTLFENSAMNCHLI